MLRILQYEARKKFLNTYANNECSDQAGQSCLSTNNKTKEVCNVSFAALSRVRISAGQLVYLVRVAKMCQLVVCYGPSKLN